MSNENTSAIVSKVWSFCNPLRDIGVGYGDYLEQLTYLLFLKMADEFSKPPYNRKLPIPTEHNWGSLTSRRGDELEQHYSKTLNVLSRQKGVLGQIFVQSQNKIKEPAMLYKIIDMIDKEQWATLGADIKGTIYEGLLEKNAEDTKSGAGQYFTPRALIRAMVECVQPEPMKKCRQNSGTSTWGNCGRGNPPRSCSKKRSLLRVSKKSIRTRKLKKDANNS